MKTSVPMLSLLISTCFLTSQASADPQHEQQRCPPDSVRSGTICMDKYEMSIWETTDRQLIRKIRKGTVTLADLLAAGAIQHGTATLAGDDYGPGCPPDAAGCRNYYAVSIKGVRPSGFANWFQAAAAARNSQKRLATNAEWQVAALGTPEGSELQPNGEPVCNVGFGPDTSPTGSRPGCVSDVGAFDMVGNIAEFVADWVPRSTTCASWTFFSNNEQCLAGAAEEGPPGAIFRGGTLDSGPFSGPFHINGANEPIAKGARLGYRAVR
jgi:hypothetical protein